MKPEILEMLPEIDIVRIVSYNGEKCEVIYASEFKRWLDKLTDGARVVSALSEDGVWENRSCSDDTHTALLICPREIKKQTPLEILKDALEQIAVNSRKGRIASQLGDDALVALAKIEAAT